jgi:LysM repeat protein
MRTILILLLIGAFAAAGLTIPDDPTPAPPARMNVQQYIEMYSAIAIQEMLRSRIPASITLAQGILESGNGNSRLAREANNHFGIKCKNTWNGPTIYEDDDAPQECFRKYESAIDSYKDHSDFLMNNTRYAFLFDLDPKDYKGWAHGLKKAGYATNPQYGELLITFIEKHKLYQFDDVKLSEEEIQELAEQKAEIKRLHGKEFTINGVKAIKALPNESITQIAIDYDLKINEIYRYNDLTKDAICKAGDTIFIEPKKSKGDKDIYVVGPNETMHTISQRSGVKLEKLLERNLLIAGQEPAAGEHILLRGKRTSPPKLANAISLVVINSDSNKVSTEPIKMDTIYNKKVYDNPIINVATQKPVDNPHVGSDIHEFKESLSFFHTVQKGETLYKIGKKYGVSVASIKYLNLLDSDSIEIGQRLIINPAIKDVDTKEPQPLPGVHEVKQGQTLYSIANLYNLSVADIIATNNLLSDTIYIGQQLIVVKIPSQTIQNSIDNSDGAQYHTIENGDSLVNICKKYNLKAEEFKALNPTFNGRLTIGQKVRVR